MKFSDWWAATRKHVHKYGLNGKYWSKEQNGICLHENMETIEECEGSPYFIRSCPSCGYFSTIKHERLKDETH